ncbi:MAG: YhfC family intramembrane metalloprotease [Candidatus Odinarchaeota archaeon]|nr:YhfC family intramembrane metalloprotease [Candidatus Odinarchaeota archaeon]
MSLILSEILLGVLERNFVACVHVGSALLVMHSLRKRWILGIAVLYHSLLDFIVPFASYYSSSLTVWQVESIVAIFALIGLIITHIGKLTLMR